MRKFILVIAMACGLGGCVTTDQQYWGRIDCQRATNPQVKTQFERDMLMCQAEARAAGVMGTAAMPVGYGTGGAIASGLNRAIARNQIATAGLKACMARQGYVVTTQSQFDDRCPRTLGTGAKL